MRALPRREDAGHSRCVRRGGPHGALGDTARAAVALAALLAALTWPAAAGAHIRTGAVAVDYRVSVFATRLPLTAKVYLGDRAIRMTVRPGHTVTVLGYADEPFVRIGPTGVAVDEHSPTAAALGLAGRRSAGRSFVWHDVRVRGLPQGVERARWTIPLLVDGRRARLAGELWRVHAPALWPWLVFGIPFVLVTTLLLVARRRRALELSAIALGVLAAVASIATAALFAFASNASEGRWVEAANEAVFALVGLAVVARGSREARVTAAGALGLLALAVGVTKVPVLTHGVVLAVLPATPTRITVTLTIWAGAAATALGLALFAEVLE